ncbi:hypothetical protein MLD38_001917 [Melastoma candidum]|uniref:Uncharacterized protein n=1 Tax=Melastoma candidum TaxID=119954 RepID=A0ACB9SFQ9_9MYRT|nr:hypothetical protein MLD38_001917 [Melastoma candidum]
MISLAISGDETTTAETSPSRECMRGAYFPEKSRRARWGRGLARLCKKLPIRGSFLGPGRELGRDAVGPFAPCHQECKKRKRVNGVKRMGNGEKRRSSIVVAFGVPMKPSPFI